MENLGSELDTLRELNDFRDRAKELRKQGLQPLRAILDVDAVSRTVACRHGREASESTGVDFEFRDWVASGNNVEIALLAKVQNHRDICETDDENNQAKASVLLKNRLSLIELQKDLMPVETAEQGRVDDLKSVPVVAAARTMQVLTSRSETTLSRASMICYYRILRELYGSAPPDWTVGAARAGVGGSTSAFVTGECIRALFSFRDTLQRTAHFFRETKKLLEKYTTLRRMVTGLGRSVGPDHPLCKWADKTMEAVWLDWFLSTNQRRGQIGLFFNPEIERALRRDPKTFNRVSDNKPNFLFQFYPKGRGRNRRVDIGTAATFFNSFIDNLQGSLAEARRMVEKAADEIRIYRKHEEDICNEPIKSDRDRHVIKERKERLQRSASAHLFAKQAIEDAIFQIRKAEEGIVKESLKDYSRRIRGTNDPIKIEEANIACLTRILVEMADLCEDNSLHLNRTAAPTQQYIKGVLRRELSNSPSSFDAGELVFAATAYGAMTNWKQHELLRRACDLLVQALPESGRLPTKRPLHTSTRGYRLLPIGCEMTRSLAQLFENMNFEFDSKLMGRLLNIFEEKLISLKETNGKNIYVGWNFDSSPDPDRPCVWVSAISVLALDRIVRLLNARINKAVLKHFEVIRPEKPHIDIPINELIYPDHSFVDYYYKEHAKDYSGLRPIPIHLELMRAHVTRACLPRYYSRYSDGKIYSAILYGPPGTGKTTLAEVLAVNSDRPLVKLSPSDLIVQGEEFIEGRARDIFEALSMLTQAVIIFDEFEPMLRSRKPKVLTDPANSEAQIIKQTMADFLGLAEKHFKPGQNADFQNQIIQIARSIASESIQTPGSDEIALKNIADELREIRKKDDPKFRFLLAGMLPKFLKLHDAAKERSVVYFLGTNMLKDIDQAARRSGRFDLKIPLYNPCPLSRAGSFLYRLNKLTARMSGFELLSDRQRMKRFLEVLAATANEPANELAQKYFNERKENNFRYLVEKKGKYSPVLEDDKIEKMEDDFFENAENLEKMEIRETNWLIALEKHLKTNLLEFDEVSSEKLGDLLAKIFTFAAP